MSGATVAGYAVEWLELREAADGEARAAELVDLLVPFLGDAPCVIKDLGCGTGSMGRWLARRLTGPQHWILHDRDPALLRKAGTRPPGNAADGAPVTVELHYGDVTRLGATDLTGTSLVTASALLDLYTAEDVNGLAAACAVAGCPALLTLTVAGKVTFLPADPLDARLTAAFNDHQRPAVDEDPVVAHAGTAARRLLGPDAADAAASAFERAGMVVHRRSSPWRLGPGQAALTARWLEDWVAAAVGQRPDLAGPAEAYLRRRLAACAAGTLSVVIGHDDLLALPRAGRP
jgi:Methyltransferase domain